MTESLYDLVEKWTTQPWDGVRYLTITQKLGELLDEESHSGNYQGAIVGVLEGTIKSAHEMMQDGILTETEIIQQIRQLLSDSDFNRGAKNVEIELDESAPGMIFSIQNLEELNSRKMREENNTPAWWKGSVEIFWRLIIGAFCVIVLSFYGGLIILGHWELLSIATLLIGPVSTFMIAYYIRRVRYPSVFRSILIVGGLIGGVCMWSVFITTLLIYKIVSAFVLQLLPVVVFGMTLGGFSGDWFGKRQRYLPYS
jgi:hypothetical protein